MSRITEVAREVVDGKSLSEKVTVAMQQDLVQGDRPQTNAKEYHPNSVNSVGSESQALS